MNDNIEINIDDNNDEIEIYTNEGIRIATSNYEDLQNKPKINNVILDGNKSLNDLGIPEFVYNGTTETLTITLLN